MCESCRTIPLVGGFSQGTPVSPALSFQCRSILTSIALTGSQDLAGADTPHARASEWPRDPELPTEPADNFIRANDGWGCAILFLALPLPLLQQEMCPVLSSVALVEEGIRALELSRWYYTPVSEPRNPRRTLGNMDEASNLRVLHSSSPPRQSKVPRVILWHPPFTSLSELGGDGVFPVPTHLPKQRSFDVVNGDTAQGMVWIVSSCFNSASARPRVTLSVGVSEDVTEKRTACCSTRLQLKIVAKYASPIRRNSVAYGNGHTGVKFTIAMESLVEAWVEVWFPTEVISSERCIYIGLVLTRIGIPHAGDDFEGSHPLMDRRSDWQQSSAERASRSGPVRDDNDDDSDGWLAQTLSRKYTRDPATPSETIPTDPLPLLRHLQLAPLPSLGHHPSACDVSGWKPLILDRSCDRPYVDAVPRELMFHGPLPAPSSCRAFREPGSTPGGITPGFLQVGIVLDDVAGWRVFSGIFRFPRPYIPTLLHTHLVSSSSALKSSTLSFNKDQPRTSVSYWAVYQRGSHTTVSRGCPVTLHQRVCFLLDDSIGYHMSEFSMNVHRESSGIMFTNLRLRCAKLHAYVPSHRFYNPHGVRQPRSAHSNVSISTGLHLHGVRRTMQAAVRGSSTVLRCTKMCPKVPGYATAPGPVYLSGPKSAPGAAHGQGRILNWPHTLTHEAIPGRADLPWRSRLGAPPIWSAGGSGLESRIKHGS
ncbi:hypothetical protein PR048_019298 [Dryococelus australis]|uniref:Uncharacterized protein n=1 Tax=Dryococelus australis TaxID=614101 RepID=A0ABQ9H345_9NEOP|nr:hypothetical protein PR048_019298 [Dryococelus australis]